MDMDDPQSTVRVRPDSKEASKSPVSIQHRNSPIIPTEDFYFNGDPLQPRLLGFQDLRNLGVILNKKRRAATQHVAIRGVGTAWIDQDDSGTYDPSKERAPSPETPPPRGRRLKTCDEHGKANSRRNHQNPDGVSRNGSLLTFSFTTKKALDYLRSICPDLFDTLLISPDDELLESPMTGEENDIFGPHLPPRKPRRLARQDETWPR